MSACCSACCRMLSWRASCLQHAPATLQRGEHKFGVVGVAEACAAGRCLQGTTSNLCGSDRHLGAQCSLLGDGCSISRQPMALCEVAKSCSSPQAPWHKNNAGCPASELRVESRPATPS